MQPRARSLAILSLAAATIALVLSACGGSDNDKSAQDLLNTAFATPVNSANLLFDAQLKLDGAGSTPGPVRVRAQGPYRVNKGKLPSVDLDLTVSPGSGGQSISTGFLSTGDRAFVKFQDAFYEQPKAAVDQANRALAGRKKPRGSLKALGLDPRSWLHDAKQEGDEDVGGVKTTRVSGRLDVRNVLRDFNDLLRKSGGTLGASGGSVPKPLSASDINKVADVVKDPNFDVYVGKDDRVIRRVSGKLDFQVPAAAAAVVGGLKGGSLEFSVELSKVNGDQRIEAPASARPLSDLTKSLGGGALGGFAGGSSGGATGSSGSGSAPSAGGSSSGGAGSPSADAFKRYARCLDRANPSDRAALQRCAGLLKR